MNSPELSPTILLQNVIFELGTSCKIWVPAESMDVYSIQLRRALRLSKHVDLDWEQRISIYGVLCLTQPLHMWKNLACLMREHPESKITQATIANTFGRLFFDFPTASLVLSNILISLDVDYPQWEARIAEFME